MKLDHDLKIALCIHLALAAANLGWGIYLLLRRDWPAATACFIWCAPCVFHAVLVPRQQSTRNWHRDVLNTSRDMLFTMMESCDDE